VTFQPGQLTASVGVRILSDRVTEGPETLRLVLSSPQNATLTTATHTLTIDPPTIARRWEIYR
jgi:hypothetical protein